MPADPPPYQTDLELQEGCGPAGLEPGTSSLISGDGPVATPLLPLGQARYSSVDGPPSWCHPAMMGSAAPVGGDVAQFGGLGDRLGTGLDVAGQPSPEVGVDVRNHKAAGCEGRQGDRIDGTCFSNLC